ncbi:alpha/beta hydrolase [Rhizobium sullae]|uniref:alpha/beta hydrolase n=1 Tax=Rhizobium sullae TaxID=50338 RepID=UPI000B352165|nr:alpha/beta hydrolase [Rhizobium sullae]
MTADRPMPEETGILEFLSVCSSVYSDDAVSQSTEAQRAQYDALCARFSPPIPAGLTFADAPIRTVPTRRYRPRHVTSETLLLYLHGGGFVVGSLESHHAICAEIADFAGAELVAVDYRLAPEHRWPAQTDDGFAVLSELVSSGSRIVLIGDSAGGNLAAGLAMRAKQAGLSSIAGQVLIYPALGGDLTAGSYVEMSEAPGLTTADVAYYREILQAPQDDPVAAPLKSASVDGLPPAFITGAAFDPLRDDARQYAARLAQNGVEVWFREEPQMVHAWLRARHMSDGARAGFLTVCEAVRRFAAA